MDLKSQIVQSFLGLAFQYCPVDQIRVATLGGEGLEAAIWRQLGIPDDHGRLIERETKLNRNLINEFRYSVHNRLETVTKVLGATGETVDAFHFDLCGTFDRSVADSFSKIFPYIARGKGRCIAITVADARANGHLEDWNRVYARAHKLFGARTESVFEKLREEQVHVPVRQNLPSFMDPFDPEKGAKREFGLLVELARIFRKWKVAFVPSQMERRIYVSHYSGSPFRMRTYFFHLETIAKKKFEESFANAWLSAPLSYGNGKGFIPIELQTPALAEKEMVPMQQLSKLAQLVALCGNADIQEEFARLSSLDAMIQEVASKQNGHAAPQAKEASAGKTASRPPKRVYADLSAAEQVKFLLKMLEKKANAKDGKLTSNEWQKFLTAEFGYYNKKLGSSLRAAQARTSGLFRAQFEARIREVFGADAQTYLDRLAKITKK